MPTFQQAKTHSCVSVKAASNYVKEKCKIRFRESDFTGDSKIQEVFLLGVKHQDSLEGETCSFLFELVKLQHGCYLTVRESYKEVFSN